MKSFALAIALFLAGHMPAVAVEAEAQVIQGIASVIDGDTLEVHGSRIRLHGIDAAESGQICRERDGSAWRCGQAAALADGWSVVAPTRRFDIAIEEDLIEELARIHGYTQKRLRREVEPVTAQDFMRFLLRWQHVAPDTRLEGRRGLCALIEHARARSAIQGRVAIFRCK